MFQSRFEHDCTENQEGDKQFAKGDALFKRTADHCQISGLTELKVHTHLQNSKYVCVQENTQHYVKPKNACDEEKEKKLFIEEVDIEYIKSADIERETQDIIQKKAQFLQRINALKNQGTQLHYMRELERWVEENIDQFYTFDPKINSGANLILQAKKKDELIELAQTAFR